MKIILHIITSLDVGGAEVMLHKVVTGMDPARFKPVVVSLKDIGIIGERIKKCDIPVFSLGISKGGVPGLSALIQLFKIVRKIKPDIVQGWMYHGNLAAWIAGLFYKGARVFWNIRQSLDDFAREKKVTQLIIMLGGWLSFGADTIVYNSTLGLEQHSQFGYDSNKSVFIPNGFDVSIFKPLDTSNQKIRKEFGLQGGETVIGLIARYHPVKDHKTFLEAASLMAAKIKNVRFLMSGTEVDWNNKVLKDLIQFYGLERMVFLLGEQTDIQKIMCCLDILVSSSYAEAFSNVIGEAMACCLPCVVTDVGDSALIVKNTGMVVPRSNARALASAVVKFTGFSKADQSKMGILARQRIIDCFSMDKIIRQYEGLYLQKR